MNSIEGFLTVEQIQTLKEMGIKVKYPNFYLIGSDVTTIKDFDKGNPTYSAMEAVYLLPATISFDTIYHLNIHYEHDKWSVYYRDKDIGLMLCHTDKPFLCDAIYDMLIWLDKHNLI